MKRHVPMRVALLLMWPLLVAASPAAVLDTRAGVNALAHGDAAAAVRHFEDAAAEDKGAVTRYNLGTAHLAAGDLDGAEKRLSAALGQHDPAVSGRAAYNLGNVLLERAARSAGDTQRAKADLTGAVKAYRQALANAPDDADARRNLQLAAQRLEQMKPPQKEQGQQGGDSGKDQPRNGGEPQRSGQGNDSGDPARSAKTGQQTPPAGTPQAPGQKTQSQDTPGKEGGGGRMATQKSAITAGAADMNGTGMKDEDVQRILGALSRREAATMREALRRAMGPATAVERDW